MSAQKYICTCEECGELFESKVKSAALCDTCRKADSTLEQNVLLPSERPDAMLDTALDLGAFIADKDGIEEDFSMNMNDYRLQLEGLHLDGFTPLESPLELRRQLLEETQT